MTERETLTVAIVEDDDDIRAAMAACISANPHLRLLGEHRCGKDAMSALDKSAPDVLLVDLGLPDISGIEVIRFVASRHVACDILVVSVFGDEAHVIGALEAGARGFILKGDLNRDLAFDIVDLRNGGSPLSPLIARQVLKRLRPPDELANAGAAAADPSEDCLSTRENEILRMISRGFSYAETAALLKISPQTVHSHLKRIYKKLAVHSKTEAVFEADRRRLR